MVPCFPYLESLMHEMWEHEPNKRPSAVDVMKRMQDVSFLLQCAYIKDPEESLSRKSLFPTDNLASCIFCNITCAWASQEARVCFLCCGVLWIVKACSCFSGSLGLTK